MSNGSCDRKYNKRELILFCVNVFGSVPVILGIVENFAPKILHEPARHGVEWLLGESMWYGVSHQGMSLSQIK